MSSARAAIFKEILPYINSGDWGRVGDSIVFGREALDSYIEDGSSEESEIAIAVRELKDTQKRKEGRAELLARISLRQPPPDGVDGAIDKLFVALREFYERSSDEEQTRIRKELDASAERNPRQRISSTASAISDSIDTALAEKLIDDLDTAHTRAVSLHIIPLTPQSHSLAALLEEAQRCDMAGLKIATAALCRTVLEDSLKKIVDPNGSIRRDYGPGDGYISRLLLEAMNAGLIDDERRLTGESIRQAGNDAVHDLDKFRNPSKYKRKYSTRTTDLVDGMRKILEDLHQPAKAL